MTVLDQGIGGRALMDPQVQVTTREKVTYFPISEYLKYGKARMKSDAKMQKIIANARSRGVSLTHTVKGL